MVWVCCKVGRAGHPPGASGRLVLLIMMMMKKTFITRRGEGQGETKKERKATKSKGRGLEEGASRALIS